MSNLEQSPPANERFASPVQIRTIRSLVDYLIDVEGFAEPRFRLSNKYANFFPGIITANWQPMITMPNPRGKVSSDPFNHIAGVRTAGQEGQNGIFSPTICTILELARHQFNLSAGSLEPPEDVVRSSHSLYVINSDPEDESLDPRLYKLEFDDSLRLPWAFTGGSLENEIPTVVPTEEATEIIVFMSRIASEGVFEDFDFVRADM